MIAKLIDAGIDYLRVTSQDHRRQEQMFEYFRNIAMQDERLGYGVRPGGLFGFWGKQCRHAVWGVKSDWALVQSSGRFAKDGLRMAMPGIQATRIDIQMTFRVEPGKSAEVLREQYEAACACPAANHRPRAVKMIEERHAAQTVYIGKRASDIYVRIYDKFEESGKEEYKDCVRFEVEIKGRAAKALWARMSAEALGVGYLLKLLYDVLLERGIDVGVSDFSQYPTLTLRREATKDEARVAWLARSVAPTVAHLASEFGWILSFSVLFAQALTEFDKRLIMSKLALVWGS